MKVTYYLEILSSWCHWAEPAWARLKETYEPLGVAFDWRIALMNPGDFPASAEQCAWFYRRSGGTMMRSPYMLNTGWFEAELAGDYSAPNRVAEAARALGATDDKVRLALTTAAVREGRRIGRMPEAVAVASKAARIAPARLRRMAESETVRKAVEASTAEFHAHRIGQRPAFVLESRIGDKAVFSGLVRFEPMAATIDAMLADAAGYAAHAAHHGGPPPA